MHGFAVRVDEEEAGIYFSDWRGFRGALMGWE